MKPSQLMLIGTLALIGYTVFVGVLGHPDAARQAARLVGISALVTFALVPVDQAYERSQVAANHD